MFHVYRKELNWGGRRLMLETGKVARQADGAVLWHGFTQMSVYGDNAPIMQRYTLDVRAQQGAGDVEAWAEFLLHDNSAPAADYHTRLSYRTAGEHTYGEYERCSCSDNHVVNQSCKGGDLAQRCRPNSLCQTQSCSCTEQKCAV